MGSIINTPSAAIQQTKRFAPAIPLAAASYFAVLSRWTANMVPILIPVLSFIPCYVALLWFRKQMPRHCTWLLPFGPMLCFGVISTSYYGANRLLFSGGLLSLGLAVACAIMSMASYIKGRCLAVDSPEKESPWYLRGWIPLMLIYFTIVGELIELAGSSRHNLFYYSTINDAGRLFTFQLLSHTGIVEPESQLSLIATCVLVLSVLFRRLKTVDWICWTSLLMITQNGTLWFISAEYTNILTREDAAWRRCIELMRGLELGFFTYSLGLLLHWSIMLYLKWRKPCFSR